jgi:hypothetical protein
MSQVLGKARISVNGAPIDSMQGASLDIGGNFAQSKTSTRKAHHQEVFKQSKLELKIPKTADVSVAEVRDWRDVAVTYDGDDGKVYTIPKAWTISAMFDDQSGEISVSLEGEPAEEHG